MHQRQLTNISIGNHQFDIYNNSNHTGQKPISTMIPLINCRKILNTGKKKYSEDEVKQIRDFLYLWGQIEIDNNKKFKLIYNECNTLLQS